MLKYADACYGVGDAYDDALRARLEVITLLAFLVQGFVVYTFVTTTLHNSLSHNRGELLSFYEAAVLLVAYTGHITQCFQLPTEAGSQWFQASTSPEKPGFDFPDETEAAAERTSFSMTGYVARVFSQRPTFGNTPSIGR